MFRIWELGHCQWYLLTQDVISSWWQNRTKDTITWHMFVAHLGTFMLHKPVCTEWSFDNYTSVMSKNFTITLIVCCIYYGCFIYVKLNFDTVGYLCGWGHMGFGWPPLLPSTCCHAVDMVRVMCIECFSEWLWIQYIVQGLDNEECFFPPRSLEKLDETIENVSPLIHVLVNSAVLANENVGRHFILCQEAVVEGMKGPSSSSAWKVITPIFC